MSKIVDTDLVASDEQARRVIATLEGRLTDFAKGVPMPIPNSLTSYFDRLSQRSS